MSNRRIRLHKGSLGFSVKIIFSIILLLTISLSQSAFGATAIIRLEWDPNQETDLAGYRIYIGTSPRTGDDPKVCGLCGYSTMIDVGNATTYRIPGLIQRQTYYISATAYDTSNSESAFSTEVNGKSKEVYTNFDGDGKTEIAFYRSGTGVWWITPSSGAAAYGYGWGGPGFKPVPGDYDRDGKTDIAAYDTTTGAWWIVPSSGAAVYGVGWGGSGFKPVPGDYDGDGKTDVAIYNTTTGAWWIIPSSGIPAYGVGWGGTGFNSIPADYDGDGKTDIAIYNTTTGAWWIIPSSGTGPQGQAGAYGVGWGGSGFKPVPGDYDGDGKTDIAIYNTTNGAWWIIPSSGTGPQGQVGAYGVGWGGSGFTPVPGDYDGDGKTDAAIYQSSNGTWWIVYSSDGSTHGLGWGGDASDIPLITNPDQID